MQSSGFTSTPTTLLTLVFLTLTSLLSAITALKHHLPLHPYPHLYPYLQLHRAVTHQLAYTNSADLLVGSALLYQLRTLERLWGTRKFASFLVVVVAWQALVAPAVLVAVVGPLGRAWAGWVSGGWHRDHDHDHDYLYLPAGAAGVVFAGVAVWAEEVPVLWTYEIVVFGPRRRLGTASGPGAEPGGRRERELSTTTTTTTTSSSTTSTTSRSRSRSTSTTLTLSDKSTSYLLAFQLALTQFPHTLLPAAVGYLIGLAWTADLLPGGMSRWRLPGWAVGEGAMFGKQGGGGGAVGPGGERERERYEGLRRRLEAEAGGDGDGDGMRQAAHASGSGSGSAGQGEGGARRRPMGAQIADYFRGVF